ncbi:MAG: FKBP-type peptidyl-prolyl cis-trans isomerase [Thermoplasmata archaeon]|nr:FKBP-type peptidyl-prolyl cis-trans isomerase [Thermoplasmata archaeon]
MADTKKIVHINFKAYFEDTGKMFDTNIEECAKENDLYNDKVPYAPMSYVVGSKAFYPEVEEAIANAEVGKEIEVSVPCEKAAGVRNPRLIELHPLKDFYRAEINPYPGMPVTLGNRSGTVMSVGAGRVKVDFNSPLAGHDLSYKITVVDEITDAVEKAKAIMENDFGSADDFGFAILEDKIVITEADVCKFHESWPVAKYRLVSDYRSVFGLDRVEFVEVWESAKKADDAKTE